MMDKEIAVGLENIRRLRVEKEISILDVAASAGISYSYLLYTESKGKVPTLAILNKLVKALDVKMKNFF
jgi:transcriptional regulator with XRE-family HTH domain